MVGSVYTNYTITSAKPWSVYLTELKAAKKATFAAATSSVSAM